jgi:hypothetical protein
MRRTAFLIIAAATIALTGCDHGNVKPVSQYHPPKAPHVRNPVYNPDAAYGEANAIWQAPVANADGSVVRPTEPASQADRPSYETAPWATGAAGGAQFAPPGTF